MKQDAATSPTAGSGTSGDNSLARSALRRRLGDLLSVGIFSSVVNVLTLTGSIYMLQVYDRVLLSRSVETLVVLSLLALVAYGLQGALDVLRMRILSRIGARIDEDLAPAAFRAATLLPLTGASAAESIQPVRDTDQLKSFLGGQGPTALFDMPFIPLFVAGCFLLHPWLGWLAVGGGLIIVSLTALTEFAVRGRTGDANESVLRRHVFVDAARRHAEAIDAMGMRGAMSGRWQKLSTVARNSALAANDVQADLGGIARIFRVVLQSCILGLGAYLAIQQEISGGAMIAASIMVSRALAPIETAIGNWRGFVAARQAYQRLSTSLAITVTAPSMPLPVPTETLRVEAITLSAPGRREPILVDASLMLYRGAGLAIIGPSGSGKSSLARALVGVWAPSKGDVRLDGAALGQWDRERLGQHIGYLPQDLALPDGTIAETIARLDPDGTSAAVIKAAKAAGAHDMIVAMPDGYATQIGDGGAFLSGGQRQRVGLARALYGDPFLVVLDEPNSNLDADGDEALSRAIQEVRARGGIAIVVTHRPSTLSSVDQVALVMDRTIKLFGPKEHVLRELGQATAAPPTPIHVVRGGRTE